MFNNRTKYPEGIFVKYCTIIAMPETPPLNSLWGTIKAFIPTAETKHPKEININLIRKFIA
ncbi:hypothetical protein CAAU_0700 [Caloramator australicus RC3]|uniref:Uncharacterized protein n=1 Tax=Caloramator australicus RC3 TaxID=857293 RepID=I7K5F3_9CLOT|nr:hypothetical protein CAAU_0700 [Caloramator australicus RC3]